MTKIFQSKSSPFFHFARMATLDGLNIDELMEYVNDIFQKIDVKYDEALRELMELLDGHPDYCMQILQELYLQVLVNKIRSFCVRGLHIAGPFDLLSIRNWIADLSDTIPL